MEFLLLSQKKNRTWVHPEATCCCCCCGWLAVAAVVLLVAQPRLRSSWATCWAAAAPITSCSWTTASRCPTAGRDTDAFAEAKKVVQRIARRRRPARPVSSRSRCCGFRGVATARNGARREPDLLKQPVGSDFARQVGRRCLAKMKVTQTAAGPLPALQAVGQSARRAATASGASSTWSPTSAPAQWNEPARSAQGAAASSTRAGAEFRLINCVDRDAAQPGDRVARRPPRASARRACRGSWTWPCRTSVPRRPGTCRSCWARTATAGRRSRWTKFRRARPPRSGSWSISPPPARTRSRPGWRATPWRPTTTATATVDLPADVPVLLVDGDAQARDARYLSMALAPGGSVRTGVRPQIETPRYLSLKPLARVSRPSTWPTSSGWTPRRSQALEKYVAARRRRGLLPRRALATRSSSTTSCIATARGCFPLPLAHAAELLVDRLEPAPDVQVEQHFIFRVFAAKRNTFLQTVSVAAVFRRARRAGSRRPTRPFACCRGCATAPRWWSSAASARAASWPF